MKKLSYLVVLFVLAMSSIHAQQSAVAGPVIEADTLSVDYGTIEQGANGERFFVVKNTGTTGLVISSITTPCSCTKADESILNRLIAPGEKEKIKVRYDTNRIGQFTKVITVQSNAVNGPILLTIRGTVRGKSLDLPSKKGS